MSIVLRKRPVIKKYERENQ